MVTNNLERVYTIPLRTDFIKVPKYYRAKRAINHIKRYIVKHMKTEDVRIGNVLNEHVWSKGITNPPGKVTIKAIKQGDYVTVELEGHAYKVNEVQTEKTDKPSSFKDKLAAKLNQPEKESVSKSAEAKVDTNKEVAKDETAKEKTTAKKEESDKIVKKASTTTVKKPSDVAEDKVSQKEESSTKQ